MMDHEGTHVFDALVFKETGYTCYRCWEKHILEQKERHRKRERVKKQAIRYLRS